MRRKLNIFFIKILEIKCWNISLLANEREKFFFLFFRKFILVIAKYTRVLFRASVVTNHISDIFDFHFQTGEHSV